MDLLSLLRLTIRRWVVVVPVLLVTLVALVWLATHRGSDYMMQGSYLLVASETLDPPPTRLEPAETADTLASLLGDPSVPRELQSQGLLTTYSVVISEVGTSLRLTVTGGDPAAVVATLNALVDMAPQLVEENLGAGPAATVNVRPLTQPTVEDVTPTSGGFSVATSLVITAVSPDSGNPFPASLATVQSLITMANSAQYEDLVADAASGATYTVTNTIREAPLVDVVVHAPSAVEARAGYEAVHEQLDAGLKRLQDEADVNGPYRTVLSTVVPPPAEPEATPSSLVRPAAGIVILGTGLAVAVATLLESFAVGRRSALEGGTVRLQWPSWLVRNRRSDEAGTNTSVHASPAADDEAPPIDTVDPDRDGDDGFVETPLPDAFVGPPVFDDVSVFDDVAADEIVVVDEAPFVEEVVEEVVERPFVPEVEVFDEVPVVDPQDVDDVPDVVVDEVVEVPGVVVDEAVELSPVDAPVVDEVVEVPDVDFAVVGEVVAVADQPARSARRATRKSTLERVAEPFDAEGAVSSNGDRSDDDSVAEASDPAGSTARTPARATTRRPPRKRR